MRIARHDVGFLSAVENTGSPFNNAIFFLTVLVVLCVLTMKFVIAAVTFLLGCEAFSPRAAFKTSTRVSGISEEFGIPCEEDCALVSYPNLPASVHPGVVSGQALVDLLNHAKDNGKLDFKLLLEHT